MVPDIGRVITKKVHRLIDRMDITVLKTTFLGHIIAKRIALDQVTIIDKDNVLCLATCGFKQGRDLCQTNRVGLAITVIVIINQLRVDVGGFEDTQRHRAIGQCRAAYQCKCHRNPGHPGSVFVNEYHRAVSLLMR